MTQIDAYESQEAVVALLLDDLAPPRLGSLLRGARKRGDMTRREVAARVGTTTSQLRRYERGDAPVPARVIASLAETARLFNYTRPALKSFGAKPRS